jgi:molybdenum-dependent DNA-binding transcriptional regulator ModE
MRGGSRGGGATLTEQGHKVLDSFRRLEDLSKAQGRGELLVIGRAASHAVAKQESRRRFGGIYHGETQPRLG